MNKIILAVIAAAMSLSSSINTANAGNLTGPKLVRDYVLPYDTDVFSTVFIGEYPARIEVKGNGTTDLDCSVFDENNNRVAYDNNSTDYCRLNWSPAWTGYFRLEIKNLGPYNNYYIIATN